MAKVAFTAPGLTVDDVEKAVARGIGWLESDSSIESGPLAKIDQAITAAGQAACMWRGRLWWWLQQATAKFSTSTKTVAAIADSGAQRSSNVATITTTAAHGLAAGQLVNISVTSDSTFDGTFEVTAAATDTTLTYWNVGDDVGAATAGGGTLRVVSYPLRTIDAAGAITDTAASRVLAQAYAIQHVFVGDDYALGFIEDKKDLDSYLSTYTTTGKPLRYSLWGDLYMGVIPPPDDAYVLTIPYIKRHGKIANATASDAALIVPAEFHWGVYVAGAIWLLKHETIDPIALEDCPVFQHTMERMAMADPSGYDDGTTAGWSPTARLWGITETGDVSID